MAPNQHGVPPSNRKDACATLVNAKNCNPVILRQQDPESSHGQLAVDILQMCFSMLPRMQLLDVQASPQQTLLTLRVRCGQQRLILSGMYV